jgi:hypothetical protein
LTKNQRAFSALKAKKSNYGLFDIEPLRIPPFDMPAPPFDIEPLRIPLFDIPLLDIPLFDIPEFDIPLPPLDIPEFDIPEPDIPLFDIPEFDIPEFDIPEPDMPLLNMPLLDIPLLDIIPFDMLPFIILPFILLALVLTFASVQAIPNAPIIKTAERAKVFFIVILYSCLLQRLNLYPSTAFFTQSCPNYNFGTLDNIEFSQVLVNLKIVNNTVFAKKD